MDARPTPLPLFFNFPLQSFFTFVCYSVFHQVYVRASSTCALRIWIKKRKNDLQQLVLTSNAVVTHLKSRQPSSPPSTLTINLEVIGNRPGSSKGHLGYLRVVIEGRSRNA